MATREFYERIVAGAGRRGLTAALRCRREQPSASLLVVEGAPWPGGSLRTQRTNGYVCELGAFAFAAQELAPLLALLPRAPTPLQSLPVLKKYGDLRPLFNVKSPNCKTSCEIKNSTALLRTDIVNMIVYIIDHRVHPTRLAILKAYAYHQLLLRSSFHLDSISAPIHHRLCCDNNQQADSRLRRSLGRSF